MNSSLFFLFPTPPLLTTLPRKKKDTERANLAKRESETNEVKENLRNANVGHR